MRPQTFKTMELEVIQNKIFEIRGFKVMLDFDLAMLYNVENKVLKQSIRRNINRFPNDFMFELTEIEFESLRSQIVTSNRGGVRYMPFAFTEQGIAMLSSILNSEKAIEINISIIRAFVTMRQFTLSYSELKTRIEEKKASGKSITFLYIALRMSRNIPFLRKVMKNIAK